MKFQQSLTFTLSSAAMAVTLGCTAQADTAAAHSTAKPAQVRISVCPATCSGFIRPGVSV